MFFTVCWTNKKGQGYFSWRDIPVFIRHRMSGSHSCASKWDPKEVPHHLPGEHSDPGLGRPGNRESQPRRHYEEGNYNDSREPLDVTMMLDEETAMSPGLDAWMQHNPSPERSQGRSCRTISGSRSRSPERCFNRAGFNDRSTGDQPRKEDIVGGRSHSGHFSLPIHQNYKDAEDRRYLGTGPKDSRESSHVRTDASKYFNRDDTSRARESNNSKVTSYGNTKYDHHQIHVIPCKFFASGNCRKGIFCHFSHHRYNTHETLNRSVLEKRAIGSSLDDNPASESRSMVHQMDGDKARKNNKRDYITLTSYGTGSRMGVSESRGEAVQGVEGLNHNTQPLKSLFQEKGSSQTSAMVNQPIFGINAVQKGRGESFINNGNPRPSLLHNDYDPKTKLLTQDGTSREADVLNTARSGAVQSTQSTTHTEQFSNRTCAALNAWNTLGFMQASVPSSAAPDVVYPSVSRQLQSDSESGKLYDPVKDSMELINTIISEQPNIALDSTQNKVCINEKPGVPLKLPFVGEPSGAGLCTTDCMNVDLDISSHQLSTKDEFVDRKSKENNGMKVEDKYKGRDSGDLGSNKGDGKADEKRKKNDEKSFRAFKFALAEFVKVLLQPTWKEGRLNREEYKTIVKKVVQKVTTSIERIHIPQSEAKIESYLASSKPKLLKLVQAYVEKVKNEKPSVP